MVTLLPFSHDSAGWLRFLLEVSVRGAVVLALTAAVCLTLRRASAALRHLLWTLAIICLLCLPLVSLLLPAWRVRGVPRLPAPSAGPVHQSLAQPEPGGDASIPALTTAAPATILKSSAAPSLTANRTRGSVERWASGRFPRERIPSLALAVWALGAAIALLPALVGLVCVARLVRRARPVVDDSWCELMRDASAQLRLRRPVRLMCSPLDTVPMICGWRRPVLLLPAGADGWTDERRRLVLLHELAHVKRADCLIQMLGQIACALHWFNPLAWLAGNQLRRQGEQACDDLVLASGFNGSSYAGHLLDIAKTLRRPPLLQAAAVAMARPSGLEGRIRAVLDPRRSRQALTRRAAVVAALATTVLLGALATVHGADAGAPNAVPPHGAEREPWQSWLTKGGYDPDRRLEQSLRIEILGRSAVSALALLSEKTGVSLQVAPEDVETLGDRKLTVIAQGCSLKGIMVQVPTALQECHWDINTHGPQPVYLLHRNSGADEMIARLATEEPQRELQRQQEKDRPARETRIAEARRALTMSPEELSELEKTDLYLARSVKDPKSRSMIELFLSMPASNMQQFVETGQTVMDYSSAPDSFRNVADDLLQRSLDTYASERWSDFVKEMLNNRDQIALCYQYFDELFALRITVQDKGASGPLGGGLVEPAVWPQFPHFANEFWYRPLLLGSGTPDEKTADALAKDWRDRTAAEDRRRKEEKRKTEWREPRSEQLHRIAALPFKDQVDPIEVQRFIASETGLSLVSDYFTSWMVLPVPEEARTSMPIWRLLYLLGDEWFWSYDWNEAGDCLVFHDRRWYTRVPQEVPESLIEACREKLRKQGGFTLDDAAEVAAALARRTSVWAGGAWPGVAMPTDLGGAGLNGLALTSPHMRLYASFSTEQRAQARSAAGLPFAGMTQAQQDSVRQLTAIPQSGPIRPDRMRPVPEAELSTAVFRVRQSSRTTQQGPGDLLGSGPKDVFEFTIDIPGRELLPGALMLQPPRPSTAPAAAGSHTGR